MQRQGPQQEIPRDGVNFVSSEVKSQALLPLGNVKAARSVNHRGLPGGGGLWVCMRRPQQLYGPLGTSARALSLRSVRDSSL